MEALTDFIVQKKENGLTNFEVAEILKNYQRSKGEVLIISDTLSEWEPVFVHGLPPAGYSCVFNGQKE